MVAYRAETAMAQILRQKMTRHDDARSLLRAVYNTEVDINPDMEAKTLTIRLHPPANNSSDQPSDILRRTKLHRDRLSRHRTALDLRIGVIANSLRSGGLKSFQAVAAPFTGDSGFAVRSRTLGS